MDANGLLRPGPAPGQQTISGFRRVPTEAELDAAAVKDIAKIAANHLSEHEGGQ